MDVKVEQRTATPKPRPDAEPPGTPAGAPDQETPKERRARKAHRVRLYVYVIFALAVVAYLIALGAANTAAVEVSWVFGSSSIPLVWLVLSAAVLGIALGLLVSLVIRWRTRRPHKQRPDERATDRREPGPPAGPPADRKDAATRH